MLVSSRRWSKRALWFASLVLAAAGAAYAAPTWRSPEPFGLDVFAGARVVHDPLGNTFLAGGVMRFAVRPPGGSFGPLLRTAGAQNFVAGTGAPSRYPVFAFDADGNGLLLHLGVASGSGRLEATYRPAGTESTLGVPQVLGQVVVSDGLQRADLAMNPDGEALAAWIENSTSPSGQFVRVASRPAGPTAEFDLVNAISLPVTTGITDLYAALDPDGAAIVVWVQNPGGIVTYSRGQHGSVFGPPIVLDDTVGATVGIDGFRFAHNAAGDCAVTWSRQVPEAGDDGHPIKLYAAYRPSGGGFADAQRVSADATSAFGGAAVVLDDGTAIVAFQAVHGRSVRCGPGVGGTTVHDVNGIFTVSSSGGGWTGPAAVDVRSGEADEERIVQRSVAPPVLAAAGSRTVIAYSASSATVSVETCATSSLISETVVRRGVATSFGDPEEVPGTRDQPRSVSIDATGKIALVTSGTGGLCSDPLCIHLSAFDDSSGGTPLPGTIEVLPIEKKGLVKKASVTCSLFDPGARKGASCLVGAFLPAAAGKATIDASDLGAPLTKVVRRKHKQDGTARLKIKLSRKGKRLLVEQGEIQAVIRVVFVSSDGVRSTADTPFTFRRSAP